MSKYFRLLEHGEIVEKRDEARNIRSLLMDENASLSAKLEEWKKVAQDLYECQASSGPGPWEKANRALEALAKEEAKS